MTGPFVAYVGNLSFTTTAQSIGEFFEGGDCEVAAVNMAEDDTGRSRGFGHVTFATRESLIKSLQADGVKHDGRAIKVDIDRKGQRDKGVGGGFGDRGDRERRYRDDAPTGKSEDSWGRAAPRAQAPAGAGGREGGYQPARDTRPPREGGGMRRGEDQAGAAAATTRPVVKIQPRTKPLDEVAAPGTASSSIFGEAKPRDASVFDKTVTAATADKPRKERSESDNKDNSKDKKDIVFKERKAKEGEKGKEGKSAARDTAPIQRGQAIADAARKDDTTNNAGNKDRKKDNAKADKPKAAAAPKVRAI